MINRGCCIIAGLALMVCGGTGCRPSSRLASELAKLNEDIETETVKLNALEHERAGLEQSIYRLRKRESELAPSGVRSFEDRAAKLKKEVATASDSKERTQAHYDRMKKEFEAYKGLIEH